MNLEKVCKDALPLIQSVGAFIASQLNEVHLDQIDFKDKNSLVSYVDKTAEEQLVSGLSKILPEATFLTEEETVEQADSDLRWVIDPLDGTTNYLHRLPCYSISIALEMHGEYVIGIVYDIPRDDMYHAWKDGGAWLNDRQIRINPNTELEHALIATGFPYYDYQYVEEVLGILRTLLRATRGIRRFGSAAIDLAYTAAGHFDAYYEYSINAWDIAAGIVLVREAGGQITSFTGHNDYVATQTIIAANPDIHKQLLDIITKYPAFVQS